MTGDDDHKTVYAYFIGLFFMPTPNDGFGCVKVDLVFQLVPSYSFTFTAPVDDLGKTYGFLRR